EEGIAQMQETSKKDLVNDGVQPLVAAGRHIPFPVFCGLRPAEIQDPSLASVFYAQSLSVVVFLLEKYGQEAFYRLSKELRGGRSFEGALETAYPGILDSIPKLEERWVRYILD
ncbi:MAG: hypothetical protein GX606_00170, partial [Elusimicrobia bacterium]|nr:hypothetical protein [Elusimicrobiota bacterium]